MKEDRQDLTTGSIWGKMLFFSIPLVLTNFLQVLFNMADIAVIGQFAAPVMPAELKDLISFLRQGDCRIL